MLRQLPSYMRQTTLHSGIGEDQKEGVSQRASKRVLYEITDRQGKIAKIRGSGAKQLVFASY